MFKIIRCDWCFTQNRVNVTHWPENDTGFVYCGKCKHPIVKFKGGPLLHKCTPVRRPRPRLRDLL